MLFSSISFLYYFLPAVIIIYFSVPKKHRNAVLLFSSLFFYAWGEQALVLLFALTVFVGWLFALLIEKNRGNRMSKVFLFISVLFDFLLLGYYKYADLIISSTNFIFGISIPLFRIALPIGISFYTFQLISYSVDVYHGDIKAQKNIIDFTAYISFFPQLIAGPIVRYSDIAPQLKSRAHTVDGTAGGVRRFVIGLSKKVLIANVLAEGCVFLGKESTLSILSSWLRTLFFTLQVYFDFSGYSDMAIGLGSIFGFSLPENFNYPYISKSVTEFWRRWHITLGSWFRDYIYIPLGGNRRGIARQLVNILLVWMLTGLWHGASINFVLWGLYFALLLTAEKLGLKKFLKRHATLSHIYVIFAVLLSFSIFNASSAAEAFSDIAQLFAFGNLPLFTSGALYCLRSYLPLVLIATFGSTPLPKKIYNRFIKKQSYIEPFAVAALLLCSTAYLVDGSFNPFLYFRF